jgi:hypothetical protein
MEFNEKSNGNDEDEYENVIEIKILLLECYTLFI